MFSIMHIAYIFQNRSFLGVSADEINIMTKELIKFRSEQIFDSFMIVNKMLDCKVLSDISQEVW